MNERFYIKRGRFIGINYPMRDYNPEFKGSSDVPLDEHELESIRKRKEESKKNHSWNVFEYNLCWCDDTPENIKQVEADPNFIRWTFE